MKRMSSLLILIPIAFILLVFLNAIVQNLIERSIEKAELEIRMRKAGRRRNFHNEEGKLDKKQYLGDLYKLIKDNLDEVKRLIDTHENKTNIYKLLKDKTSLMNEFGKEGKTTIDDLKN